MEFQVTYSRREVLQAVRYHFLRKPEIRIMVILVNVFALLSAVLFGVGMASPLPFLMGTALWLCFMMAVWFWMPVAVYRRNRTFRDSIWVRLAPSHLFIETVEGVRTYAWRQFSYYYETPGFIHLCFNDSGFFLLPKRSIPLPDGLSEARRMIGALVRKA